MAEKMKKKKMVFIPFLALPLDKAIDKARKLRPISDSILRALPHLHDELIQGEIDVEARDYVGVAIIGSLMTFFYLIIPLMTIILLVPEFMTTKTLLICFSVPLSVSLIAYNYILLYPKFKTDSRMKQIEFHLLFAMRHILIRVKGGIPLFNAMQGIGAGDYGEVSHEFSIIVREIEAGTPQVVALENAAFRNPSISFRRVIWQLSNSLRAGVEISKTLETVIENLTKEQSLKVKKYGAQLNPLALVYMMFSVVVPSLGITFMIILGSFLRIEIPKQAFYLIPVALIVFQYFFMGLVKTRRPAVVI